MRGFFNESRNTVKKHASTARLTGFVFQHSMLALVALTKARAI